MLRRKYVFGMLFDESVKLPKLLMGKGTEIPQLNKLLEDVITKFREYSLDVILCIYF